MKENNIAPQIAILNMSVRETSNAIIVEGKCLIKLIGSREKVDTDLIHINIPIKEDAASISFGSKWGSWAPGGYRRNTFKLKIDIDNAREFDIQNKLIPVYREEYPGRFIYDFKDLKKGRNRNSAIIIKGDVAIYFRQTKYNTMNLVVRDANQYDTVEGQQRLESARIRAKNHKDKGMILMYEKNCSRYEESASVLYEKLIDAGYDNVYYIVDTSIAAVQGLDEKYKKNLIDKDSDRHLECFFACKKFISSETIDHSLQLRIANKHVQDKYTGKGLSYVFLQHGVMYMVSLSSKLRTGFRKKTGYKLHRTVVSSELEAKHFIDMADMDREDLYITGLAKFDKCYRNNDADKIVIMPTWRRWETNQAKEDVESTGYYKMIENMYNGVPDDKKDKVVILPHPLMIERFKDEKGGIADNILITDSYDRVLRDCDLLITDYSSIAYDAFYRGANVIFYWKDKDECMSYYGEEAKLMLNEDNVFGPVCMNEEDIRHAVESLYKRPQDEEAVSKYRRIVEFHDGRNSERIIEKLIEDGMIEKS